VKPKRSKVSVAAELGSTVEEYNRQQARIAQRRHRLKDGVRQRENERGKAYRQSPEGKAKRLEYERRPEVKERRKRYAQSERGHALHLATASRYRDRNCSGLPTGRPKSDKLDDQQILAEYLAGDSSFVLAERYGVSPAGIIYRLHAMGAATKPRSAYSHEFAGFHGPDNPNWIEVPVDEIVRLYDSGMTVQEISRALGSTDRIVSSRLKQKGIRNRYEGWGRRLKCDDNHVVRSGLERAVCNWLYSHGILHRTEPKVPWKSNHRGDFLVGDTYIEVWGVTNSTKYEQTKSLKCSRYQECGAKLIEIYPRHILDNDFSPLLQLVSD